MNNTPNNPFPPQNPMQNMARVAMRQMHPIDFNPDWVDSQGFYTGLIDWAMNNLKAGDVVYIRHPDYDSQQRPWTIAVLRRESTPTTTAVNVEYTGVIDNRLYDIVMTERSITVSYYHKRNPRRIYRPFLNDNGTREYKLVRETVTQRYAPEGVPAFQNYLIQRIEGLLWRALEDDDRIVNCDDFIGHAMDPLFVDRTLTDYNDAPTTPAHVGWFTSFRNWLTPENLRAVDADELGRLLMDFMKRFSELSQNVGTLYSETGAPYEDLHESQDDGIAVEVSSAS